MPSKKSSQNHGTAEKGSQRPSSPLFKEDGDPIETVISLVEKKGRNLSKRKDRLTTLQEERQGGKELDKDQLEAISKLPDVLVQIDFLHDMQKQFSELHLEYHRHIKSKLKMEEKKKKEEKQLQKSSLAYCLRIQFMLEQLDEDTKQSFRNGSNGAVQLAVTELKQVDDFYNLVHPQRPGNTSFDQDVLSAAQHMTLLHEESSNKVVGSTYKNLHKVFDKIDRCGFLNIEQDIPSDEDTQEEEYVVVEVENDSDQINDFTPSLEEVQQAGGIFQQTIENIQEEQILQTPPTELPLMGGPKFGDTLPTAQSINQPTHVTTSAPSPDFAGLGSKTVPSMDFQFMQGDPQPSPSQTTPSSFPSTFSNTQQDNQTIDTPPSQPNVPYVPETGQQMNEKSDLVGTPVVGGHSDKVDQSNNGSFKSQGNDRQTYDNRRPYYQRSNNGNNRQRPYNNRPRDSRRDGGNYGESRKDGGNYGESRRDGGNYGESRKDGGDYRRDGGNYGDSRRDGGNYGDSRRDGGSYGGSNRMDGGKPRGGRGRSNYPYNNNRQPQNNRSNGSRTTTNNNNTRPQQQQQPSYASTAAAQS